jgi:hypothetical protein
METSDRVEAAADTTPSPDSAVAGLLTKIAER